MSLPGTASPVSTVGGASAVWSPSAMVARAAATTGRPGPTAIASRGREGSAITGVPAPWPELRSACAPSAANGEPAGNSNVAWRARGLIEDHLDLLGGVAFDAAAVAAGQAQLIDRTAGLTDPQGRDLDVARRPHPASHPEQSIDDQRCCRPGEQGERDRNGRDLPEATLEGLDEAVEIDGHGNTVRPRRGCPIVPLARNGTAPGVPRVAAGYAPRPTCRVRRRRATACAAASRATGTRNGEHDT